MIIFRKVWRKALQVFSRIAVPKGLRRLRRVRGPGYETSFLAIQSELKMLSSILGVMSTISRCS